MSLGAIQLSLLGTKRSSESTLNNVSDHAGGGFWDSYSLHHAPSNPYVHSLGRGGAGEG